MKGFICPHCAGSIQIPHAAERLKVAMEMAEEGMPVREAERLCGLSKDALGKHLRRRRSEDADMSAAISAPPKLEVVDWRNGKARRVDLEKEDRAMAMFAEGKSRMTVARALGIGEHSAQLLQQRYIGRQEERARKL